MLKTFSIGMLICSFTLAGCAHKLAECDYATPIGNCSASVDPSDTSLVLSAPRCSQVELRANGRTRIIRTDSGAFPIASTETNVEVVSCQSFKDLRGQ